MFHNQPSDGRELCVRIGSNVWYSEITGAGINISYECPLHVIVELDRVYKYALQDIKRDTESQATGGVVGKAKNKR